MNLTGILPTYSFRDVHGTFIGPGGSVILGSTGGSAEEGISVEPVEDTNRMTIGAGGQGFHTLIVNKAARITVRLLKTSPVNAQLQNMFNLQRSSSLLHGRNAFDLSNPVTGDTFNAIGVAFGKQPGNQWAKDPNMREWELQAIRATQIAGALLF